jgi:hypothetical protein
MNADRYQHVKQVFLEASELESGQVAAFLDQACAGDPELRKEVESLLLHHLSETITRESPAAAPRPERFPPGTILAGRYRIIGPLGRGGMGDVYRADDLKLDQAVALKFLDRSRAESSAWLRQYENEVRLARKVTHPNVMRVYDISEAEGEVFISMEYVDGEDLASLLRRIGRLTGDKASQIARQLCAGLGAAHDQGVLHRDLKPANVMIDGQGRVRIADFGIAALACHAGQTGALVGTPGFMAPELFAGAAPSVRSDLYSLGIVLYETVTGKQPFAGSPTRSRAHDTTVIRPSTVVPQIDAALERVILQCLEHDPGRRPDSAYAVAAALPGGDALALALAAGETPSPSMVAAAGAEGTLHARVAIGCLAVAVVALLLVIYLADRTFFLPQAGLTKSPAVLADKAERVITALGHAPSSQDHRQGFALDRDWLEYAKRSEEHRHIWKNLASGHPPAICFWYHAGAEPTSLPALLGEPSPTQVSSVEPDLVAVRLDGRGRLLEYAATGDRSGLSTAGSPAVDWSALWEMAGLPKAQFQPIPPSRAPPMYADSLVAWEGAYPEAPELPIRVEGASLGERVVYFAVSPPWDADWTDADEGISHLPRPMPLGRLALNLVAIIGGSFLAWHNLRTGRGDQRGAARLVVFVLVLGLFDWLLGERHVAALGQELATFYVWMARATLTAAIAWVSYFAVEPYVRRYWPQIMITWSRVLGGKFRDPLVGRDVLIGGMCGILLVLVLQLDVLVPGWLGLPRSLPKLPGPVHDLGDVLSVQHKLSILISGLMTSISLALVVLLLMLVLRVLIRPGWLAMGMSWLLLTALEATASAHDFSFPWLTSAIIAAVAMLLLVRVGVVALVACSFFWFLLVNSPLTTNLQAWYAPASTCAVVLAAALLGYGFFNARAGQPLFWQRLLDR